MKAEIWEDRNYKWHFSFEKIRRKEKRKKITIEGGAQREEIKREKKIK